MQLMPGSRAIGKNQSARRDDGRRARARRAECVEPASGEISGPLVLAYYNEMSYDEIAAALDLGRNHVATLIFRAKQQLRQKLEKSNKER